MKIINGKKIVLKAGLYNDLISRLRISQHATEIKAPSDATMAFEVSVKGVVDYCQVKVDEGQEIQVGFPFSFWNLYKASYQQFLMGGNFGEEGVFELPVFIYADATLLEAQVPIGLTNGVQEDGVTLKTFAEWLATWSSSVAYSLDEMKVLIPTNIGNKFIDMGDVMTLLQFTEDDITYSSELCHIERRKEIINSVEFLSEVI
jgi:hypothetical protein